MHGFGTRASQHAALPQPLTRGSIRACSKHTSKRSIAFRGRYTDACLRGSESVSCSLAVFDEVVPLFQCCLLERKRLMGKRERLSFIYAERSNQETFFLIMFALVSRGLDEYKSYVVFYSFVNKFVWPFKTL